MNKDSKIRIALLGLYSSGKSSILKTVLENIYSQQIVMNIQKEEY